MNATINRSLPPEVKSLHFPAWPDIEKTQVGEGIPVVLLPFGLQPVAEVQLILDLGAWNEGPIGAANFTARLLTEGTSKYKGTEIAERLDALGAFINVETGADFLTLSLSVLSRNLRKAWELLLHVVEDAHFPKEEFELQHRRSLEMLSVEEQKTSWQARRALLHRLYGSNHPYAAHAGREELLALSREAICTCHQIHFKPEYIFVLAAGVFENQDVLEPLAAFCGDSKPLPGVFGRFDAVAETQTGRHMIEMPRQMQSSIRIGQMGFLRNHPDMDAMRLLNTIFGGYFGSRLMSNIREDKGYTYGIGSAWVGYQRTGYFTIATDVGKEYVADTLVQIHVEMDRMLQESIPQDELEIARNYLLGRLISETETPFQVADRLKYQWVYGLPDDEWSRIFEATQSLTSEQLLATARKYFLPKDWVEVVAGS